MEKSAKSLLAEPSSQARLDDDLMYEPAKAAHIIAYLALKSRDRAIDMLKAIKLLYIAEREHIRRYGMPMLDEPRAALASGPVNSFTYDRVKGANLGPSSGMMDILDKTDHNLLVREGIEESDLDELSDAEAATLDQVWDKLGQMTQFQLVDWTHDPNNVPEWTDPSGSSKPIDLLTIMEAVGVENAKEHAKVLTRQYAIERKFVRPA